MAEAFPVSGNIDPQSFPHLLVDLHRHGATGSLKVNGPVHPKALYFRGGRVLFGSSNDPKDQLGAILIESGRITRDQLDEVNAKVGPGNPLAKVLAESGFVNQRELGEAARMKVERILADVLAWESGTFEFEDGVLPKGAVDLKLSTEKLLLAAVQRVAERPFALRHLELSNVLEPSLEGESALAEIRADVWPVLERLDGRRTLKDAIALTRLDEFEAMKTACAMLFLGIVRKKATVPPSDEVDLAEEAQSGFGQDEGPMYTVPIQSVAVADLPAMSGFASESVPAFAAPEPEPEPPPAPASFDASPQAETFPEVEPDEPPVFTAETTMLPGQAPIFTMADYIKRAETEVKPEERMAFEPKTEEPSPETVYAMPAPSFSSSPPPSAAPPLEEAPEEAPESAYSSTAPTLIVPEAPSFASEPTGTVYSPFSPLSPSATAPPSTLEPPPPVPSYADYGAANAEPVGVLPEAGFPTPAAAPSKPSQENLAALDALLNPGAAANRAAGERSRQDKFEPQFRPPSAPPRRAAARTATSSTSRLPLIFAGLAGVVLATVAAWYFLLRTPEPQASPQPAPPTTVAAAPVTTMPPPTLAATTAPTLAASTAATPAAVAATPTPPPPTPRARDAEADRSRANAHAAAGRHACARRNGAHGRRRSCAAAPGLLRGSREVLRDVAHSGRARSLQQPAAHGLLDGHHRQGGAGGAGRRAVHPAGHVPGPQLLPPVLGRLRHAPGGGGGAQQRARLLPAERHDTSPLPAQRTAPLSVRRFVLVAAALGAAASPGSADSIVLTSGRVIEADRAWVEGTDVRYQRNDAIYSVPRDLVARVDAAGGGPGLEDPDVRLSRERLAAGETQDALLHARVAVFRRPQFVPALQALAAAQVALGDATRARQTLGDALALEPENPRSLELLGDALADAGDFAAAREQYQRAAAKAPTPRLTEKLDALGPVSETESSARFRIRFDGAADQPLGLSIVKILDQAWQDHEQKLGFAPSFPVTVVLQTAKAFYDTTRAPGWVAAWNDGIIRVPVAGLERPTAGLVRVLRHEMAHSFVAARTGANCPTWLQEGLAQWLEGGDPGREDKGLVSLARSTQLPKLESLERPFVGLPEARAQLAYAGSLSAVAYIMKQYGTDGLRRIVAALAAGQKPAEALPAAIGLSYADLQKAWEQKLAAYRG